MSFHWLSFNKFIAAYLTYRRFIVEGIWTFHIGKQLLEFRYFFRFFTLDFKLNDKDKELQLNGQWLQK